MNQWDNKSLCPNCFTETKEKNAPCPICGYRDGDQTRYPIALPLGTILLGKYVIGKLLGKGGFGITYLAYHLKEGKIVAIKEYFPDTLSFRDPGTTLLSTYTGEKLENFRSGVEKFYEEAKIIARFDHPHIIHVSEFFYENNTAYFVMEYINGVDLKTYVAQSGGKLSEQKTLSMLLPLLDALECVHAAGILHRDVSPDNIFITSDGTVKLLDFGSARQVLGEQSKSLSIVLKPGFAPIEQYQTRGKQGEWTDIYALAATAYYCLTGRVPEASMDRIEDDSLTPPSLAGAEVSSELESVLLKALSVRAVSRYQNCQEFKQAFSSFAAGTNPSAATAGQSTPGYFTTQTAGSGKPAPKTNKAIIAAVIAACVTVIGTAVIIGSSLLQRQNNLNVVGGQTVSTEHTTPTATDKETAVSGSTTAESSLTSLSGSSSTSSSKTKSVSTPPPVSSLNGAVSSNAATSLTPKFEDLINTKWCLSNNSRVYLIFYRTTTVLPCNNACIYNLSVSDTGFRPSDGDFDGCGMGTYTEGPNVMPVSPVYHFTMEGSQLVMVHNKTGAKLYFNKNTSFSVSTFTLAGQSFSTDACAIHAVDSGLTNISPVSKCFILSALYIDNNHISDISALSGLVSLGTLEARNNNIKDISALSNLNYLTKLSLTGNSIINLSAVSGMKHLNYAEFSSCNLIDIQPIAGCTELTNLSLEDNSITDISCLSNLSKLQNLYLRNNRITDISVLYGLTHLEILGLSGNNLTNDQIAALKSRLPNTQIF